MGLFTPQNWNTFQCFRPSISRGLCFRVRWVVHPTKNRCFGIFGLKRSLWTGWNRCALKWWTVLLLGALKPLEMDKCFFFKAIVVHVFLVGRGFEKQGKTKKTFWLHSVQRAFVHRLLPDMVQIPFQAEFCRIFLGVKSVGGINLIHQWSRHVGMLSWKCQSHRGKTFEV